MKEKGKYISAFFIVAALIAFCYFFIDRKLAFFFYTYKLEQYHWIYLIQQMPELFLILSPLVFITGLILYKRKATSFPLRFCVAYPVAVWLANLLKMVLKVVFGRYWPATFKDNNLSLLQNGAYGFNPFHTGISYESFPSGHAATILAFATVVWLIYPRLRWAGAVVGLSVCLALLVLCYHFAGDIIAGSYLGILSGMIGYRITRRVDYPFRAVK